ncbi:recombinase family protein [Methylobacterium sp. AMS5]|uniref:recombinase family protein n=1 Tax=Methylobacterium sp. AMS5 TaxID=925818 RepID=UPI00074F8E58|nr:recombinase family protein [Methylobacterium sp. AMS5]AMB46896.1 resolvase [Methylobacterium sp. AMS5]
MATGTFVAYFRVSTSRQGVSGLGLDAQRETVRAFLNGGAWTLAAEFVEVESGRTDARPELAKALARCRVMGAILIVANVSRLTRSVAFLSRLLESGVEVRFCDMPQIEGATGRFLLTQMVSVAELEAGMIGERTRKALAAAKARGRVLGGRRENSAAIHQTGAPASRAVRTAKADKRAADLAPIIADVKEAGATSLREIAAALNERGIPTVRGGAWSAVQVQRAMSRLPT